MNKVLLDLGFIQIKWYSLFILLSILSAYYIISKESKKKDVPKEYLSNLFFYGIIIGILGARLYYVIFNLNYYLRNPIEIIMIWHGGLAIHGGIIACLIFLIIYSRKYNVKTIIMTDIISVGLILAQSIGRWGNFFNQEAYGRIVSLNFLKNIHIPNFIIKGMYIDGEYREPTFLYESVLNIIGFIILIMIRKSKKIHTGTLTGLYLIWYGSVRFIIEILRSDSLMIGNLKIAMIISVIAIISGIITIIRSVKTEKKYIEDKINN